MNIIDYCKWRGDLDFKKDPFNYLDNLLIAYMTYVPLDGLLPKNSKISIKDLAKRYLESGRQVDKNSFVSSSVTVLLEMAKCKRFKDLKVYNYVSILHQESTEQFAALMLDIDKQKTVVSFRGTDDTLIGWHEDLLLSYKDIKAQVDALNYVNKNCQAFHKYYFIGHSKGGNLALYAAVHCYPRIQHNLIEVISNDGPGLRSDSYDLKAYQRIESKYVKIMPEFDLFGIIYDLNERKIIVSSSAIGIMQHSATSWNCLGNDFERVEDISKQSKLFKLGIENYLKESKVEEREIMIEEIFASLKQANINNITDFSNGGIPVMVKAIKSMSNIDDVAKESANKLIKVFTDAFGQQIFDTINNTKDKIKIDVKDLSGNIESFISNKLKEVEARINND